jgi:hypothetical protein
VSAPLFLALVAVYVVGVAGVVAAGTIVESRPEDPRDLDDRLALIRETTAPGTIIAPHPRHSRRARRVRRPRSSHRRADASRSLYRAVESIARAFTPVVSQRMRSDVATSGSLRSARSR